MKFARPSGRLAGVAVRTGLHRVSPERMRLAGLASCRSSLYIKAESEQPIGSFKLRGAYNRIAQALERGAGARRDYVLQRQPRAGRGLCGAGVGARAVIVMPQNAPGDQARGHGGRWARRLCWWGRPAPSGERRPRSWLRRSYSIIPPYDDAAIIAGQGDLRAGDLEQALA